MFARAEPRLDHPAYARMLVVFAPALALVAGLGAARWATAWTWVLLFDLWLLSFPHVASTFTRTAFRGDDVKAHRGILFALPFAALGLSAAMVLGGGLRALNTLYFFSQTFHYARQSRGVHRALRRAAGRAPEDPLADAVLYLVALWTLCHRCALGPAEFFGAPLWSPVVPRGVELTAFAAALTALGLWVARLLRDASREDNGREASGEDSARDRFHQLHVLGHVALFVVSYVAIADATRGWIAVNLWHNAQYLLFVRAWNFRRFSNPLNSQGFLATISRPMDSAAFFAVCGLLGAIGYASLARVADAASGSLPTLPLYLILIHAVNFHHYTADALLWRAPLAVRALKPA